MNMSKQIAILLEDLLEDINCTICIGDPGAVMIRNISADSRHVVSGSLFIALEGETVDGHDYIDSAVENGAAAVMIRKKKDFNSPAYGQKNVVFVEVDDTQEVLGRVASRFFANPADHLTMIGVTGTNGKTTVTYLMEEVLRKSGIRVGVIGTVNYRFLDNDGIQVNYPANFTTPDPVVLFGVLREMSNAGVTHVLMEVSSHALDQRRVGPLSFALAIFTNLSQDHLDYHHTMLNYFDSKALLFREKMLPGSPVIIHEPEDSDDDKKIWTDRLLEICAERQLPVTRCGRTADADFKIISSQIDRSGTSFLCRVPGGSTCRISSPLIGHFNIENLLVSMAALLEIGVEQEAISKGLEHAAGAPGRMQRVDLPVKGKELPVVLVDYAHTPDALENVLATARELPHNNIYCVFGCGGDRDRSKRPLMGEIASRYADVAIVTDDNPRSEDPSQIRDHIIASKAIGRSNIKDQGWLLHRSNDERGCVEIADRIEAIRTAVHFGGTEDIVLIAGKGHEQYQITVTGKSFFDDCLVARDSALDWDTALVAAAANGTVIEQGMGRLLNKISTDSRTIGNGDIFIALSGESFNGHDFLDRAIQAQAACLVVSEQRRTGKGDYSSVKVDDTLTALGDLAGWRRQALKRLNDPVVVGITGSCGKTTVKEMTASIFSKQWPEQRDKPSNRVLKTVGNFNNLIGLPLSLLPAAAGLEGIVLEMGMNQRGEIERLTEIADPDIACITNVHSAHLEGLGSIENVARAKAELFAGSRTDCVHVVNLDDERIVAWSEKYPEQRKITYSVTEEGVRQNPDIWATEMSADSSGHMSFILHVGGRQAQVTLQAPGLHNCSNSCAAAAIAYSADLEFQAIVEGLENFTSTVNRMESMRTPGGLSILNDTYNANPASMASALDTIKSMHAGARVAILGDMLELGAEADQLHRDIGLHVSRSQIHFLGVYGSLAEHIARAAIDNGMEPGNVVIFYEKQRVVDWVAELLHTERLHQDDWILVKASRGLALDTVVDQLMKKC